MNTFTLENPKSVFNAFVALEKRKALGPLTAKETLSQALSQLETTRLDVINRWNSPSDFDKFDLVVGEFLKRNLTAEALKYMIKVRNVVDATIYKLRDKADAEGALAPEEVRELHHLSQGTFPGANRKGGRVINSIVGGGAGVAPPPLARQNSVTADSRGSSAFPSIRPEVQRQSSVVYSRQNSFVNLHVDSEPSKTVSDGNEHAEELAALDRENTKLRSELRKLELRVKELSMQQAIAADQAKTAKELAEEKVDQAREALLRSANRSTEVTTLQVQLDNLQRANLKLRDQVRALTTAQEASEEELRKSNAQLASYRSRLMKVEEAMKAEKNVEGNFMVMLRNADDALAEKDKLLRARNKAFATAREHHNKKIADMQAVIDSLEFALHERDQLLIAHGIPLPERSSPSLPSASSANSVGDDPTAIVTGLEGVGAARAGSAGPSGRGATTTGGADQREPVTRVVLAATSKPPTLKQNAKKIQAVYGSAPPGAGKKGKKAAGGKKGGGSAAQEGADGVDHEPSILLPDGMHATELHPIQEESSKTMAMLALSDAGSSKGPFEPREDPSEK